MAKNSKKTLYLVVIILLVCVAFYQCIKPARQASAHPKKLTLALYPYVPRLDQFKTAVSNAWKKRYKNVELEFVSWDCYSKDPNENLDVFVFDAIFLDYFQSKGFLEPITGNELDEKEDLLEYAREGVKIGDRFYGVPQAFCFTEKMIGRLNQLRLFTKLSASLG